MSSITQSQVGTSFVFFFFIKHTFQSFYKLTHTNTAHVQVHYLHTLMRIYYNMHCLCLIYYAKVYNIILRIGILSIDLTQMRALKDRTFAFYGTFDTKKINVMSALLYLPYYIINTIVVLRCTYYSNNTIFIIAEIVHLHIII